MADHTHKVAENIPGPWYVDDTCTPCRTCLDVTLAETLIRYNADESYVYFFKQPDTAEEKECAAEMSAVCPQNAIGEDGE